MASRTLIARLSALSALLTLAGCWTGPILYAADPTAAAPLTPGVYRQIDADGTAEADTVRFVRRPDGSFAGEPSSGDGHAPLRMVFAALPVPGRSLWTVETIAGDDQGKDVAIYGLAEQAGSRLALAPALECRGSEALVRTAGGEVRQAGRRGAGEPTCLFGTRAPLERALRAYAAHHLQLGGTILERLGD